MPPTTSHPLLENGQLKTHVNILELIKTIKENGNLDIVDDSNRENPPPQIIYPQYEAAPLSPVLNQGNLVTFNVLPEHIAIAEHSVFKRHDGNGENGTLNSNEKKHRVKEPERKSSEGEGGEELDSSPHSETKNLKVLNKVLSREVRVEKVKYSKSDDGLESEKTRNETTTPAATIRSRRRQIETKKSLENSKEEEEEPQTTTNWGLRKSSRIKRDNYKKSFVFPSDDSRDESKNGKKGERQVEKLPQEQEEGGRGKKKEPVKRYLLLGDHYSNDDTAKVIKTHYESPQIPQFVYNVEFQPGTDFSSSGEEVGIEGDITDTDNDNDNIDNHYGQHDPHTLNTQSHKESEFEQARTEVKKILSMCSGCHSDPFAKVSVISWKSTPKKLFSGASLLKAQLPCENF